MVKRKMRQDKRKHKTRPRNVTRREKEFEKKDAALRAIFSAPEEGK